MFELDKEVLLRILSFASKKSHAKTADLPKEFDNRHLLVADRG